MLSALKINTYLVLNKDYVGSNHCIKMHIVHVLVNETDSPVKNWRSEETHVCNVNEFAGAFTVHSALRLRSTFANLSSFISVHRIPISVRSPFAQNALTVGSECDHRSLTVQLGK